MNPNTLHLDVLKTLREYLERVLEGVLNFEVGEEMNIDEWDAHFRERGRVSEAELNEKAC